MFDHQLHHKLDFIIEAVKRLEEQMASATQGLTDLNNAVAAQAIQSQAVITQFQALATQIAALQAQEGEVTDAQLETLAQTLNAAQASVAAALAPATSPTPTPSPATPAVKS
jgi:hypothetical protein